MELKVIKTKKQYQEYLDWIDKQLDTHVKAASPLGEKVQVALLLLKQYEDAKYPIPCTNPSKYEASFVTLTNPHLLQDKYFPVIMK